MADGSKYVAAGNLDEFILNPEMVQQAGEEYFPKPETIMEIKMKITKEKIHKLIQEQYELNAEQREKLLIMLTTDVVSAIQALELINTLDIGYAKAGLLGDALMLSGRDYKKRTS